MSEVPARVEVLAPIEQGAIRKCAQVLVSYVVEPYKLVANFENRMLRTDTVQGLENRDY